jgi:hypothetical protein
MLDLTVFVPRLKQVIGWTEHLMQNFVYPSDKQNHGDIFRQINPIIGGQPLYSSDWGYTTWNLDVYDLNNFEKALQITFKQRDEEALESNYSPSNFQSLGRIIYFETHMTTHDGAPIAESNCFVDESDVPPIDTWFFLDRNNSHEATSSVNLFCWIPKRFEPIMEAAISAEIFDSYHWLDEAGPLTHQMIVTAMAE